MSHCGECLGEVWSPLRTGRGRHMGCYWDCYSPQEMAPVTWELCHRHPSWPGLMSQQAEAGIVEAIPPEFTIILELFVPSRTS